MIIKPNALQRLLHRFFMIGLVTAFFAPRVHRLDIAVLQLTNRKYSLVEILGWPIVMVTTLGAKTNQPRSLPLVGIMDDQGIALIASNFGRQKNPAWYYNLRAHPECFASFKGKMGSYMAREIEGAEYDKYWQLAVSYYAGYEKYKEHAAPRHIPIMVLEPKKQT